MIVYPCVSPPCRGGARRAGGSSSYRRGCCAVTTANLSWLHVSPPLLRVDTVAAAVEGAHRFAQPGDVVLFSPGGTSYDAYRDFAERGRDFKKLVAQLPDVADKNKTESTRGRE